METIERKAKRRKLKGLVVAILGSWFLILGSAQRSEAQSVAQDIQQLVYDIEKLTQFKAILSDMKTGYTILTQGYGQVKSITEGNFNLHSAFLNSLMAVSPAVRQYGRIADIISYQAEIVSECNSAYSRFRSSGRFTAAELIYLNDVFSHLLSQSVDNLTNLANVITAGKLRMNDAERLESIDHIYADTQGKMVFLRHLDNEVTLMQLERQKALNEVNTLQKLY